MKPPKRPDARRGAVSALFPDSAEEYGERQYREKVVANARLLLSAAGLVAVWVDPWDPDRLPALAYGLLGAFLAYSLVLVLLLRSGAGVGRQLPRVVHGLDIAWVCSISLFTTGPNSAFFVFYAFVILAAAFRWRLRETMATAGLLLVALLAEAWILSGPARRGLGGESIDLQRLIIRSVHLLIVGFLAGFLAEKGKQAGEENALLADLVREARETEGFRSGLAAVAGRLLAVFGAAGGVAVVEDLPHRRAALLELGAERASEVARWHQVTAEEVQPYFFPLPGPVVAIAAPDSPFKPIALGTSGHIVPTAWVPRGDAPIVGNRRAGLLVADLGAEGEWRARAFLLDPGRAMSGDRGVRVLYRATEAVAPVLYTAFLLGRLRQQASALERARVAREIHDGSLGQLAGIELQMQVLEHRVAADPDAASDARRIRGLLHEEALNLRDLMYRLRPSVTKGEDLPSALADLTERFARDTGVAARAVATGQMSDLAPATCREVVRIVQEALVNVRKHSGASEVSVTLERRLDGWRLTIDDDGRGFDFSGELTMDALEAGRRGPRVIMERVRALGGTLSVLSTPGRGSRISIRLAAQGSAAHA